MDMNDFAGSVKELRKRMGLTQKELATRAKISKRTVEKREQDGIVPQKATLCLLRR